MKINNLTGGLEFEDSKKNLTDDINKDYNPVSSM